MELVDYLRLLVRGWVLIVICCLLGLAVGGAYLATQPVLYTASASTFVSTSSAADVAVAASGTAFAQSTAANLSNIADSPYVLNNVRRALRVTTSAEELADDVDAQVLPNSSIIQVNASTTSPELCSALANAVVVELSAAAERLNPNVGNASSIARTTTIRRAVTPTSPSSPAVVFDLGVGLLAGFALAVVLILLRQSIDQRVRSAEQVARVSRGPVIGTIPLVPPASEGRPVVLDPARISGFRAIRSEILEGAAQNKVVVVSGTMRSESTAAIATSIGASVANARLSTLVVDAVTTSAPAAPIFEAPTEPGLTEALDRSMLLDRVLVPGPVDGLWYLPPGRPSGQREDLIASYDMTDLLEAIISKFNVVIINTDAVEDSPIARTLGRQAEGVVLVSELNRTSVPEVRRSTESLERGGVRLIGTILVSPEQKPPHRRAGRATLRTAAVEA